MLERLRSDLSAAWADAAHFGFLVGAGWFRGGADGRHDVVYGVGAALGLSIVVVALLAAAWLIGG